MIKSILLFIVTTISIILSIKYLNTFTQLNLEALASFLFLVFVLAPLLVYYIYLIARNIENYLTNKKSNTFLFKLLYNFFYILKIIYGLVLSAFSVLLTYYDITKGWDSWLEAIIHILIIILFFRLGVAIVYQTVQKNILKK